MLKRTKGRILLSLLVVTGLAGTVKNTSLSSLERKIAIAQLKNSRADLLNTLKGLSKSQLDFRPSPDDPSIRECFYQLVANEKMLWDKLNAAIKKPATPEKRSSLITVGTDVLAGTIITAEAVKLNENLYPTKYNWKTMADAVSFFKYSRMQQLKYLKTTTADLRNRLIEVPEGWVDCYQFIICISAYSNLKLREIQGIIAAPGFPLS
jgi:hypothetical protein